MCLILLALEQHARFPLVMATNRDEFHARPTRSLQWWEDRPLLGGKDLESGGTWLGITPDGRMAAVTNYRSGAPEQAPKSRGELPLQVLERPGAGVDTLHMLQQHQRQFGGFNLLFRDEQGWFYTSNRDCVPWRRLYRGIFGLSNHLLQTAWPKVRRGQAAMRLELDRHQDPQMLHEALLAILRDERRPPQAELPDTGVGLETEQFLSPPFIRGEHYGTRASTVITQDLQGRLLVSEVSYRPGGQIAESRRFEWPTGH